MQFSKTLSKSNILLLVGAALVAIVYFGPIAQAQKAVSLAPPSAETLAGIPINTTNPDTIVFAGGCFWGIQAVFQHTHGVTNAVSGYAGGKSSDATYDQVSGGGTNHAEAVQVSFDPKQVSYAQLLQIFFSVAHDPTQLNRQYPDVGAQYRSAVFYKDAAQKLLVERYVTQLNQANVFPGKIVTQVNALDDFFPAENYHQNYATLHPESPYIARFDLPKIGHLKSLFPDLYREKPALVVN